MIEPHRATILVVEDNADNMFVVIELVSRMPNVHFVDGYVTGRELFRMIESRPTLMPELILLDIQIPGEDGYMVLKRIRLEPRLAQTRVVALTANVMPQDIEKARLAGFDGFIGKPISFHRFPAQIDRILQGESVWESR